MNPLKKSFIIKWFCFFVPALFLFVCSCSEPLKKTDIHKYYPLSRLSMEDYPAFTDDHGTKSLEKALRQSISYYGKISPETKFEFGDDIYDAVHIRQSLEHFLDFIMIEPSEEQLQAFLKKHYVVYTTVRELSDKDDKSDFSVMFTGYYEPSIEGSLIKDDIYCYPIYSRPSDLITVNLGRFSSKYKGDSSLSGRVNNRNELVPYYTRAEINSRAEFEKVAKPVVWLKSRIDRFFLEIQGSGRVILREGGVMRVQYNSKNGQPYRAIGKYLADKGEIQKEKMSMQAIRRWLEMHPDRIDDVLHYNPSFVFFHEGKGGPYGCLGVEVTPMRSIATDVSIFPKGALCFIETTIPTEEESVTENVLEWKEYAGFVLNQDTGGAIKGAGRADLFCGNGAYAEKVAGHMKQMGRLYFLVLKKAE
ncbi:Membrane-bound lytic murein transglycosylase A (precursor) (Murein hydrolase A) (Mlt38) [Desulfamplus magnetovallimortis]|uniref:peptidoglycan lytic exotransglycosylase n=1 Tax=Desulfamplus magnetovallimortis TaxID=1246637 RepID=A0A1W1HGV3_9BACT|nr:MltA domain-containing protein [Desulfamplus magnetovallimortis]SLM31612.1 Membrane-bound lytic murein transglycosylase A (precursor) (Murein hydrolase A) (Mlt38) [Desulfamplus magnetovallimortis]